MTARHQFIMGSWALLACILFVLVGAASWSHFDAHHNEVLHISYGCAVPSGFECKPPTRIVTTTNRAPAVALFALATMAGFLAVYCFTSPSPELQTSSASSMETD